MHQGRSVGEVEPFGHADDFGGRPNYAFGVASLLDSLGNEAHPFTWSERINIISNCFDDPSSVASGNFGKCDWK